MFEHSFGCHILEVGGSPAGVPWIEVRDAANTLGALRAPTSKLTSKEIFSPYLIVPRLEASEEAMVRKKYGDLQCPPPPPHQQQHTHTHTNQ